MNKIKICNVLCDLAGGGAEAVIYNYFSHMNLEKYEIHIITHGITDKECAQKFMDLGFKIHVITPKRNGLFKNIREMNTIIRAEKFHIIHAHLTEWNCIPMIVGKMNGVKIRINHSHSRIMIEHPNRLTQKIYYGIRKWLGKLFSTDYFACGDDAGKYLFGEKAYNQGKVIILNNAIELKKFEFNQVIRNEVRNEFEIGSKLCIGHIGRFSPVKNHSFLIDIFSEIHKKEPNSVLLLAGIGDLQNQVQDKVNSYNLNNDVKFLGVRKDTYRLYQAMDAFILPSFYEGMPLAAIEAQAAGLTCFLSDTITSKVKMSEFVSFISLEKSREEWADEILSCTVQNSRKMDVRISADYDIHHEAEKLECFFERKLKCYVD